MPSPIILAAAQKDMNLIQMLDKAGADLNYVTPANISVLSKALDVTISNRNRFLKYIEPVMDYFLSRTNIGNVILNVVFNMS